MRSHDDLSKSERAFLDQWVRKVLVDWCAHQVKFGGLPSEGVSEQDRDYARAKGWLTKDGERVTAKGCTTATSFLKR